MSNNNLNESLNPEKEVIMIYGFYMKVCCICQRTTELVTTTQPHMDGAISHGYCETCEKYVMASMEQQLQRSE